VKPIDGPSCSPAAPQLQPEPGKGVDVQFRAFRPLYEVEGRSGEDRERRLKANLGIRKGDLETYRAEIARHLAEAKTCDRREALIRHGRWILPEVPRPPSGMSHRELARLQRVNDGFQHETKEALADLGDVKLRLEGRRAPLDVDFEASVSMKLAAKGHELGFAASASDRSASVKGGHPSAAVGLAVASDGRVEDRIEVGAGGAKWTVTGDRLESFAFQHGPVYGSVEGATVTAGVGGKHRIDSAGGLHVEVTATVGVSVTGIDPETVRLAFSREDAWALTPAEPNQRRTP
jgi:hypothetical protein